MKFRISIIIAIWVLTASAAYSIEKSRPDSIGGDYLFELNIGLALEEEEDVEEVGFDVERFLDGSEHHFSIGFATELEFKDHGEEIFLAPLFSVYYFHMKLFLASGLLTDFDEENEWKTRLGLGYEFFLKGEYLLIPIVAIDYIDSEFSPALGLGLAHEF